MRKTVSFSHLDRRGFTLAEVMVTVAVLGIVSVGVMSLMENMMTAQKTQRYGNNTLNLIEEIRSTLASPQACIASFKSFNLNSAGGNVHPNAGAQIIYDNANPPNLAYNTVVGDKHSRDVDNTVQIKSMTFTDYKLTPGTNGYGQITLEINYLPTNQSMVNSPWKKQSIILETQETGGGLTYCIALSKMSDNIWQVEGSTAYNIFFNSNLPDGLVGIGTGTPHQALDIFRPFNGDATVSLTNQDPGPKASARFSATAGQVTLTSYANSGSANPASATGLTSTSTSSLNFTAATDSAILQWLTGATPTAKMTLTNAGRVGIGITAPVAKLHVADPQSAGLRLETTGTPLGTATFSTSATTHIETTNPFFINEKSKQNLLLNIGQGYVGIGTASPASPLTVWGTPGPSALSLYQPTQNNGSGASWMDFNLGLNVPKFAITYELQGGSAAAVVFRNQAKIIAGADRWWQMFAVGNQGFGPGDQIHFMGGTNPTGLEQVVIDHGNFFISNGNATVSGTVTANGNCVSGPCFSDERLKDHISRFRPGLKAVLDINPVNFRYNGLGEQEKSARDQLGVLAQDVEKGAPELVSRKAVTLHPGDLNKTEVRRVDYGGLIYIVINAIKEFYAQIQERLVGVDHRLKQLENENVQLKAYICAKDKGAPFCAP